jgi:hypothetical protein
MIPSGDKAWTDALNNNYFVQFSVNYGTGATNIAWNAVSFYIGKGTNDDTVGWLAELSWSNQGPYYNIPGTDIATGSPAALQLVTWTNSATWSNLALRIFPYCSSGSGNCALDISDVTFYGTPAS